MKQLLLLAFIVHILSSCFNNPETSTSDNAVLIAAIPTVNYSVANYYPHDINLSSSQATLYMVQIF